MNLSANCAGCFKLAARDVVHNIALIETDRPF
jgi:hypothetical protein